MTEHKKPVDQLIDLFVYAPLGFALDARSLLPKLIDRGRGQVTNQVTLARMMGQFAVQQGQTEAGKQLAKVQEQATTALVDLGLLPKPGGPDHAEPRTATETTATEATPATKATPPAAVPEPDPAPTSATPARAPKPSGRVIVASQLAIPDYDSLAASQVIPRLAGLAKGELESVRAYEAGHRGRKTILNKIAQLQG